MNFWTNVRRRCWRRNKEARLSYVHIHISLSECCSRESSIKLQFSIFFAFLFFRPNKTVKQTVETFLTIRAHFTEERKFRSIFLFQNIWNAVWEFSRYAWKKESLNSQRIAPVKWNTNISSLNLAFCMAHFQSRKAYINLDTWSLDSSCLDTKKLGFPNLTSLYNVISITVWHTWIQQAWTTNSCFNTWSSK